MGKIVDELANGRRYVDGNLIHGYPKGVVADSLDGMKNLCFRFAARSGLTISIDDVKTPAEKAEILDGYEKRGREGRRPVPQGHHHRRRAPPEGSRDLDHGHRRGPRRDGDASSRPSSSTPST